MAQPPLAETAAAPRNPSLVARLIRAAAMWTIPSLLIAALLMTWLYRNTIYSSFDDPLESAVTALIASVDLADTGDLTLTREPLDPRYQRALSGRYWMIGQLEDAAEIRPLVSSRSLYGESLIIRAEARRRLAATPGEAVRFEASGPNEDEPLRVIARQIQLSGMDRPVIAMAAADRRPATRSVQQFAATAIVALGLFSLGLLAAIYAQVRLGLRPLFQMRDRIAEIRLGKIDHIEGDYARELDTLSEEINRLIDSNKQVVERAQTHVGNLAHGLKTPLAVLQNEAQMGDVVAADVVSRQTAAMRQQVDHHLRRARAAARGQAIGLTSDVDPVIDGLARTLPRIYRDKDLEIDVRGEVGLRFRGHGRDLEDMVGNLMDNAAKWSNGQITVRRRLEDGQVAIRIEDDGPGIPDEEISAALQRGVRLDEQTPGSGLGLSIVADLADAYGGSLDLSRADLGGLRADLTLPVAAT